MTTVVKIDRETGNVLAGTPQTGDFVRITLASGAVIEQEYTAPAAPVPRRPNFISRVRFDAVFAGACGEAYYLGARLALKAYAESAPLNDNKAAIARGLEALNNPPPTGIDFPFEGWQTDPDPLDITGALLRGIIAVLENVSGFEDIADKVDAALEAWAALPQ